MKRIDAVLASEPSLVEITVRGWVRSFRNDRFIAINDGSTIHNLQCVIEPADFEQSLLASVCSRRVSTRIFGTLAI